MCLIDSNLNVSLEKTCFLEREVEFLDYLSTLDWVCANLIMAEAIKSILSPQNLKEFTLEFIEDYSKVAKPITNVTMGEYARIRDIATKNWK